MASDLREMPRERWPDVMLPIGGQVYADEAGAATLARLAGGGQAGDPLAVTSGPWFDNMLAALEFGGRQARFSLKRAAPEATRPRALQPVCEAETQLSSGSGHSAHWPDD